MIQIYWSRTYYHVSKSVEVGYKKGNHTLKIHAEAAKMKIENI